MKAITLSTNSWHHKLAKLGSSQFSRPEDLCSYTHAVMIGALLASLICLMAAFCTVLTGAVLAWLCYMTVTASYIEPSDMAYVGLLLWGITGAFATYIWYSTRERKQKPSKPPGFVKVAYRSMKDKFCVRVDFVDPTE